MAIWKEVLKDVLSEKRSRKHKKIQFFEQPICGFNKAQEYC